MNTNENTKTPQTDVASPDVNVVNPQATPQSPSANGEAKKSLHERLKETSQASKQASQSKIKIPTGTKIEDYYKEYDKEPLKKKRGRPKKYPTVDDYIYAQQQEQVAPPIEEEKPQSVIDAGQTDKITPIINHTAIPLLAKKFKRLPKECMLNKEQLHEIACVMPANSLMTTPSWLNYGITLILICMTNFMLAEKIEATPEEKQMLQNLRTQIQDIPTIQAEPVN